ncbi:hypothetical protein QCA50_019270 [Cerrena zonata]|uniref:Uncharacterized protein n=1 Tax=Cerrena zonata TaxID=2478898 RepID=A0AAW0FJD1_9APHY
MTNLPVGNAPFQVISAKVLSPFSSVYLMNKFLRTGTGESGSAALDSIRLYLANPTLKQPPFPTLYTPT